MRVQGRHWGLDMQGLNHKWCMGYLLPNRSYMAVSRDENRSGVARKLVKYAGGEAFASQPAKGLGLLTTPADVLHWAESIERGITALENQTRQFMMRPGMSRMPFNRQVAPLFAGTAMPALETWVQVSRRRNGHRGENVRAMDKHLRTIAASAGAGFEHKRLVARAKLFKKAIEALQRRRDPHDKLVQGALAYRAVTVAH